MTEEKSKYVHIVSVGKNPPDEKVVDAIERGKCIHCESLYDPMKRIVFVKLGGGEVIWWCTQGGCMR